jgi:hypothetical protein
MSYYRMDKVVVVTSKFSHHVARRTKEFCEKPEDIGLDHQFLFWIPAYWQVVQLSQPISFTFYDSFFSHYTTSHSVLVFSVRDRRLPSSVLTVVSSDSPHGQTLHTKQRSPIHDLGTRWGWVVSYTPRPGFTPWKRTPCTHCTEGWRHYTPCSIYATATIWDLAPWRRSLSKCYLRIQSVPQREHHTSPIKYQLVDVVQGSNLC